MRILITGANGQVGYELLRVLRDGAQDPNPHPALTRHPLPEGEGKTVNPSPRLRGEGGRRPGEGQRATYDIIPATRSGECSSPLPPGKSAVPGEELRGAPQGRVRVRACEVLDLADFDGLTKALDRIAPDVIINAAAYTAVDRAEDEPELAQRINGDALGVLGAWAKQHSARVVHYSTDYVFDGRATRPYCETDAPHPASVYGHSKLAGEIALRDSGARYLIFRTAWVYAARGQNFLRTMLRLGAERDELRVVDDQIGAPTPARLIAEVTAQVVAQWGNNDVPTRDGASDGLFHLVTSGQTSWCGFAREIFECAQRAGLIERAPVVHAIGTADYPTRATRPAFSVLDTARLRQTFGIELPDWQTALDVVIDELAGGR